MTVVAVKERFHVRIPKNLLRQVKVRVGDLLEGRVERGKITFTPKSVVDRSLDEALEDIKQGRVYGPFATHEEMFESLHRNAAELRKKRRRQPGR